MSGFARSLAITLGFEGGYVNDLLDKGGATNHGVTQGMFDEWLAKNGMPKRGVTHITGEEIEAIYYTEYWMAAKCDAFPWPLSLLHFDACVNHGEHNAWQIMQRALVVKDDGIPGPVTMQAAYAADVKLTLWRWLRHRSDFYCKIVIADKSQLRFLKGWMGRVLNLAKIAGEEA